MEHLTDNQEIALRRLGTQSEPVAPWEIHTTSKSLDALVRRRLARSGLMDRFIRYSITEKGRAWLRGE